MAAVFVIHRYGRQAPRLHCICIQMRALLFVVGIALGVLGTIAYGMFIATPPVPAPQTVVSHAPMTVSLDERFLTALMQRAVADGVVAAPGVDVPRTQVVAELRDGLIVVHANVEVLGQPTQGTITLRPVLDAGRLKIQVAETNLGSIVLPAMDQLLEQQINARIQPLLEGVPVIVTGVGVDPAHGLVLTCQVDLDRLDAQASAARSSLATRPSRAVDSK